jgi:ABC-type uncharacterized transport system fused permease/ATPase subunit
MLHVFDQCAHEQYRRISMINEKNSSNGIKRKIVFDSQEFSIRGQIIESHEDIIVENVPIITPNGDIIVESLSLKVKKFSKKIIFSISKIFMIDYTSYACSHYWS